MEKILIVDNDQAFLDQLNQIVKHLKRNFIIDSAISCEEAINKIDNNDYSIIITDMSMEEEDSGINILKRSKKKNIYTVVIVVSNFKNPKLEPLAVMEGAFDYLDRNDKNYVRNLIQKLEEAFIYQKEIMIKK
jgi:DNA-binding NtrC family response regulator